jgi:uncharacterized membrane protein
VTLPISAAIDRETQMDAPTATVIASLIAAVASIVVALITVQYKNKHPPTSEQQTATTKQLTERKKPEVGLVRRIFYCLFYFLGTTIILVHIYVPDPNILDKIPGILPAVILLVVAWVMQIAEFP